MPHDPQPTDGPTIPVVRTTKQVLTAAAIVLLVAAAILGYMLFR